MRDLAIFNRAIDSFAPVTSLNYDWTTSALKQNVRRATIVQMKKGRPVQFEIQSNREVRLKPGFQCCGPPDRDISIQNATVLLSRSEGTHVRRAFDGEIVLMRRACRRIGAQRNMSRQ